MYDTISMSLRWNRQGAVRFVSGRSDSVDDAICNVLQDTGTW